MKSGKNIRIFFTLAALLPMSLSPTLAAAQSEAAGVAVAEEDSVVVPGILPDAANIDSIGYIEQPQQTTLPKRFNIGFSAEANFSGLVPLGPQCKAITHNYGLQYYTASVIFRRNGLRANGYDKDFGLPELEIGFLVGNTRHIKLYRAEPRMPYNSTPGTLFAVYGGFRRDIIRSQRWRFGYILENGLGFTTRPYNRYDNSDNELLGSPINIYIDMGLYAAYRITPQAEISLGIDWKHFSNGALDRPNKGLNSAGVTLRANYYLDKPQDEFGVSAFDDSDFRKGFYVDVSAGLAARSLQDDWVINYWSLSPDDPKYRTSHYPIYGAFTCQVAPMYRYCRRYASGIGIDYTYAPYASAIRQRDLYRGLTQYTHSRHVVGLSLRHEVYFRHLSLQIGIGWYLHRKMGYTADVDEKPYYETIGIRYSFPFTDDRLYIGYNVKAHFAKADCTQFILGWRIGGKDKKRRIHQ